MKISLLEKYREYLPVTESTPMVTLGEGDTPLLKANKIGSVVGCDNVYFKLESNNPTGSFKDRGMVLAVAKAMEEGVHRLICASTGNTSASAAAYGARFGLPTTVIIPSGRIARGKLVQALAYGARIIAVKGNFDDSLKIVRSLGENTAVKLVNSVNPHRIQGQKTASFEIVEAMNGAPNYVFLPVGNAGNISAYWLGFQESNRFGWSTSLPKMMGFQAEQSAPIVNNKPVPNPQTIATAIRVGNPASWDSAIKARDESGGVIDQVSDEEIVEAYRFMAIEEGIFCEPASAATIAGLFKLASQGLKLKSKNVVCVITGAGLKDPEIVFDLESDMLTEEYPLDLGVIEKALDLV
tara:strand:- start:140 stop:1198 length:1059 start_codon:yes stop_codon:yes gene_type:complete